MKDMIFFFIFNGVHYLEYYVIEDNRQYNEYKEHSDQKSPIGWKNIIDVEWTIFSRSYENAYCHKYYRHRHCYDPYLGYCKRIYKVASVVVKRRPENSKDKETQRNTYKCSLDVEAVGIGRRVYDSVISIHRIYNDRHHGTHPKVDRKGFCKICNKSLLVDKIQDENQ